VPAIRPAPRSWYWSHDIQLARSTGVSCPVCGAQADRRFAALCYDDEGAIAPSRSWLIDVDAATAAAQGPRAAAVSVDVVTGSSEARFTLLLEAQPDHARALHTGLDAAGVTAHVATYGSDGKRCFAVIVKPSVDQGSLFFPALRHDEVRTTLRPLGALPTRARAYHLPAGWRLAVVAERARGTAWSVHVDVDADDVSHRLEQQHGYPLDLDAVGHGLSVRFALIAAA
jgi:hypothetical protein